MTNPTPPFSGENLLQDDEDIILLTDEIPPTENHDMTEFCQLADPSKSRDAQNLSGAAIDKSAFPEISDAFEAADFQAEIPADFAISDSEYPADDLQRLIDEVVHDSQVPPQDFSGILPDISSPKDIPAVNDALASLSQNQIDAAMERVIQNLFAVRIETLLDEVITTTVNREIENLKTVLMNYLTSGKAVHKG